MSATTADTPQVLLEHHLKALRLPTMLREYDKLARTCAQEKADFPTICCDSPSWSCSIATAAPPSAASGRRSSPWSRASTASTSSPSPR